MKELWFTAFVLLLLGILVGIAGLKPTAAVVSNLPPDWMLPTNEFAGEVSLDLKQAFFDADGDILVFSGENVEGNVFYASKTGKYNITANDGKTTTEQEIIVY